MTINTAPNALGYILRDLAFVLYISFHKFDCLFQNRSRYCRYEGLYTVSS
jgi:hypothetical protein